MSFKLLTTVYPQSKLKTIKEEQRDQDEQKLNFQFFSLDQELDCLQKSLDKELNRSNILIALQIVPFDLDKKEIPHGTVPVKPICFAKLMDKKRYRLPVVPKALYFKDYKKTPNRSFEITIVIQAVGDATSEIRFCLIFCSKMENITNESDSIYVPDTCNENSGWDIKLCFKEKQLCAIEFEHDPSKHPEITGIFRELYEERSMKRIETALCLKKNLKRKIDDI